MPKHELTVLPGNFAIFRLPADSPIPECVLDTHTYWIGRTSEELSIVCEASVPIADSQSSAGWSCLKVVGPLDLATTGILSGISSVLAEAGISIFSLSTFDTDHTLVPSTGLSAATTALRDAGYQPS